jgi:glutamate synthase (NADPH/NADH) large chain
MTGGEAYVLDMSNAFEPYCNPEFVTIEKLCDVNEPAKIERLQQLIEQHARLTQSEWAEQILESFEHYVGSFKYVAPKVHVKSDQQPNNTKGKLIQLSKVG